MPPKVVIIFLTKHFIPFESFQKGLNKIYVPKLLLSLKSVLRTLLFCNSMTSICKLDLKLSMSTEKWIFSRI